MRALTEKLPWSIKRNMMTCQFLMSDFYSQVAADGAKVYSIESRSNIVQVYNRRNFYKICLLSGSGIVQYDEQVIKFDGPVLLISKPDAFNTWILETADQPFYTCIFTQHFFNAHCFRWIEQSQLFSTAEPPVFNLTVEQFKFFNCLFQKMETEQRSGYRFKDHLIRNQICVLLHSAIHMQPAKVNTKEKLLVGTSLARYVELAEMQFPAEAQVCYFN